MKRLSEASSKLALEFVKGNKFALEEKEPKKTRSSQPDLWKRVSPKENKS